MRIRVTAILVAQQGGELLDETIAGLAEQTLRPHAVVAVNNGGKPAVTEQLAESGAGHIVGSPSRLSFGRAVQHGVDVQALPPTEEETADWVWLLSEDARPEPEALEQIVHTVQRAQTVAVAGPKLVDWYRPERIVELGQTLTRYGTRWLLRRQELDQQQYDHLQDVLGVGPVGMLVKREVWDELGGFDPALPVYDDGLDFCVRARLAGHRVEVAPQSRVRFARTGVAGPRISRRRSAMRTAHRQARSSQLHRRLSYAPPVISLIEWLALPIYAVLRVLWALIRGQPGHMIGELAATFGAFFTPGRVVGSRRRIRRQNRAGWVSIRPLRVDPKTVRTTRMIDREAILAATGRQRREIHFISSGGIGVLAGAAVASVALTWWAFNKTSLVGGGLAPLSPFAELWRNTHTLDGVPADPFTWVLALLGTLTFWNPSHAVVLFMIAAMPLAALGAWIWAAQLTESKAARALVGVGFSLSPVLVGSLGEGQLPALILTVVLPWLLLAATRCRESWSWAGTASLLAAVALACAPVLIPGAVLMLVIGIVTNPRGTARTLTTAIAPIVLFAPQVYAAIKAGEPLGLLRDPGITDAFEPGNTWQLLIGFPEFGLYGWGEVLSRVGISGLPVTLFVGLLMLPIALLAVLGLFTGKVGVTLFSALLGGIGLATALLSAQLLLGFDGPHSVPLWTGSGLAVYWIALLSLAAVGAETLRRSATPIVAVALAVSIVAVMPVSWSLITDRTPFSPGETQMPALVRAAGESNPSVRTLVITPVAENEVRVQSVVGSGLRLDEVRAAENSEAVTDRDRELAELVGELASIGGADTTSALRAQDVGYVLLSTEGDRSERAELQITFDQHAALTSAGVTDQGLLWRVTDSDGTEGEEPDTEQRLEGSRLGGNTIWAVQLIVLLALLLLALPTAEVVERPERRPRRKKKKRAARAVLPADGEVRDPEPAEAEAEVAETEAGEAAEVAGDEVRDPEPSEVADADDAEAAEVASTDTDDIATDDTEEEGR